MPIHHSKLILDCLEKTINERLTKKQKFILEFIRNHPIESITKLVKLVSHELNCSESCVWNNVNSLKKCGLIVNGVNPVRISEIFDYF